MLELVDKSKLINIKIYYQVKKIKGVERLIIIEDEEAEKLLKANEDILEDKKTEENKSKEIKDKLEIKILETQWVGLNWEDKNNILEASYSAADPVTSLTQFSFFKYRQAIVQKALRSWNIKSIDNSGNEYSVPVNSQNIGNLNPALGLALYEKYNALTSYTELDMGNL